MEKANLNQPLSANQGEPSTVNMQNDGVKSQVTGQGNAGGAEAFNLAVEVVDSSQNNGVGSSVGPFVKTSMQKRDSTVTIPQESLAINSSNDPVVNEKNADSSGKKPSLESSQTEFFSATLAKGNAGAVEDTKGNKGELLDSSKVSAKDDVEIDVDTEENQADSSVSAKKGVSEDNTKINAEQETNSGNSSGSRKTLDTDDLKKTAGINVNEEEATEIVVPAKHLENSTISVAILDGDGSKETDQDSIEVVEGVGSNDDSLKILPPVTANIISYVDPIILADAEQLSQDNDYIEKEQSGSGSDIDTKKSSFEVIYGGSLTSVVPPQPFIPCELESDKDSPYMSVLSYQAQPPVLSNRVADFDSKLEVSKAEYERTIVRSGIIASFWCLTIIAIVIVAILTAVISYFFAIALGVLLLGFVAESVIIHRLYNNIDKKGELYLCNILLEEFLQNYSQTIESTESTESTKGTSVISEEAISSAINTYTSSTALNGKKYLCKLQDLMYRYSIAGIKKDFGMDRKKIEAEANEILSKVTGCLVSEIKGYPKGCDHLEVFYESLRKTKHGLDCKKIFKALGGVV